MVFGELFNGKRYRPIYTIILNAIGCGETKLIAVQQSAVLFARNYVAVRRLVNRGYNKSFMFLKQCSVKTSVD
ncbi:unnamed protein product [Gongylonema pulchrum]|uniref:Transposase n=1 Tax=Gongylonema pulchrum TaxID=637853 RepID=A0A183EC21_9BILA|nr:unnamed protein product [Gongylonema pulchrum]